MSGRKDLVVLFGFVTAVSLISSAVTAMMLSCHYSRLQFDLVNVICGEVLEQEPEMRYIVSAALKEYTGGNANGAAITGFLAGMVLFAVTFVFRNKTEAKRIEELSDYLEQVNMGKAVVLSVSGEDQ